MKGYKAKIEDFRRIEQLEELKSMHERLYGAIIVIKTVLPTALKGLKSNRIRQYTPNNVQIDQET